MTEANEGKPITRRGFITIAAATGVALAGKSAVDWLAARQGDLANPENLGKFLPGPELFPGYHSYYNGKVFLKDGARIYAEPRGLRVTQENNFISTLPERETLMDSISANEAFFVEKPLLYLKPASPNQQDNNIFNIVGPDGSSKRIDKAQSWVIFAAQASIPQEVRADILRNQWAVGCVNMSDWSLRWQRAGQEYFTFDPQGVFFTQTIDLK